MLYGPISTPLLYALSCSCSLVRKERAYREQHDGLGRDEPGIFADARGHSAIRPAIVFDIAMGALYQFTSIVRC